MGWDACQPVFALPASESFTTLASVNGSADPMTVQLFASQGKNVAELDRSMTSLDISFDNLIIDADAIIPEPSSIALLAAGLLSLLAFWRVGWIGPRI